MKDRKSECLQAVGSNWSETNIGASTLTLAERHRCLCLSHFPPVFLYFTHSNAPADLKEWRSYTTVLETSLGAQVQTESKALLQLKKEKKVLL